LLLLLVIGGILVYRASSCGFADGVGRSGLSGECFGVTDGSFIFADYLKQVEDKIASENRDVATRERTENKPSVTVAFFWSMTLGQNDISSPESIRHALEGALVAQRRANHSEVLGTDPLVRLVLASPGIEAAHEKPTVERLTNMIGEPHHLVAVVGL